MGNVVEKTLFRVPDPIEEQQQHHSGTALPVSNPDPIDQRFQQDHSGSVFSIPEQETIEQHQHDQSGTVPDFLEQKQQKHCGSVPSVFGNVEAEKGVVDIHATWLPLLKSFLVGRVHDLSDILGDPALLGKFEARPTLSSDTFVGILLDSVRSCDRPFLEAFCGLLVGEGKRGCSLCEKLALMNIEPESRLYFLTLCSTVDEYLHEVKIGDVLRFLPSCVVSMQEQQQLKTVSSLLGNAQAFRMLIQLLPSRPNWFPSLFGSLRRVGCRRFSTSSIDDSADDCESSCSPSPFNTYYCDPQAAAFTYNWTRTGIDAVFLETATDLDEKHFATLTTLKPVKKFIDLSEKLKSGMGRHADQALKIPELKCFSIILRYLRDPSGDWLPSVERGDLVLLLYTAAELQLEGLMGAIKDLLTRPSDDGSERSELQVELNLDGLEESDDYLNDLASFLLMPDACWNDVLVRYSTQDEVLKTVALSGNEVESPSRFYDYYVMTTPRIRCDSPGCKVPAVGRFEIRTHVKNCSKCRESDPLKENHITGLLRDSAQFLGVVVSFDRLCVDVMWKVMVPYKRSKRLKVLRPIHMPLKYLRIL